MIGIGRPDSKDQDAVSEYVLGTFTHFERQSLQQVFESIMNEELDSKIK